MDSIIQRRIFQTDPARTVIRQNYKTPFVVCVLRERSDDDGPCSVVSGGGLNNDRFMIRLNMAMFPGFSELKM